MKTAFSSYKIIDPSVFLTMALAAFVSVGILAFKIYRYEPCPEMVISLKPGVLHAGEIIQFKAISTKGSPKKVQWDFGTTKNPTKTGFVVNHTFDQPGRYEVSLSADNTCGTYTTIYVQEAPVFIDLNLVAQFTGPKMAEVGEPVTFEDVTENASKWEWWFGENNSVDATSRKATYTFETLGRKSIKLLVNGNRIGEQMIEIVPAKSRQTPSRQRQSARKEPTIAPPERSMSSPIQQQLEEESAKQALFPEITVQEMEGRLIRIVDGKEVIEDIYAYLCTGESMEVTFNGTLISLAELNSELREIKRGRKVRDLEVILYKSPTTNCIFSMTINLKKKGLNLF
jgi:hypothetical protein